MTQRYVYRVRSLLCALGLAVALGGCTGGESTTIDGCGAGPGWPIAADDVLAIYNAAGYKLSRDDCNSRQEVARLNKSGADEAESRLGHLVCAVDASVPPGRSYGRRFSPGVDTVEANVYCALYPQGDTQEERRQVTKLYETLRALTRG